MGVFCAVFRDFSVEGELADALDALDARLRDIITLHYYGGKALTEIAAAMGMFYRNITILHKKLLISWKS